MSSSRKLGLHSSRYPQQKGEYKQLKKVDIIGLDSEFVDIACLDTGEVWVNCWPGPEIGCDGSQSGAAGMKYRRWGRFGSKHAAVMPFRMCAGQDEACKIRSFEIELILDGSPRGSSTPQDTTAQDHEPSAASVYLLDIPQPQRLVGRCGARNSGSSSTPWKLCSRSVTDQISGKARTAKWTWTSNNNEPLMLHGAMVVGHPGERFFVACSVQGQAYRGRTPFRFSNKTHTNKLWYLDPKIAEEDLRSCIEGLEAQIVEMNMGTMNLGPSVDSSSGVLSNEENASMATLNLVGGRSYGSSRFSGTSWVHQGDTIINYSGS